MRSGDWFLAPFQILEKVNFLRSKNNLKFKFNISYHLKATLSTMFLLFLFQCFLFSKIGLDIVPKSSNSTAVSQKASLKMGVTRKQNTLNVPKI